MNVVQRASARSMSGRLEQASPIPCQNPVPRNEHTSYLLDEMRPSPTATGPSGPRRPAGETAADHLSALPDDLLRRIMSSLRAWEVVRTCVLARRWRHLWASAPCLDFRPRHSTRDREPLRPRDFFYKLFLFRNASAPVDTLRLRSSDALGDFADDDAGTWIRAAMGRSARVIHVVGHRRFPALLVGVPFVSCHLRVLKLSYAMLDRRILGELSSSCASLEELDLKDCVVAADEIVSASLKTLIMLKCKIECDFSISSPNLVILRLITLLAGPIIQEPGFAADDNSNYGSEHIIEQEDCDDTTSDDGGDDDSSYVSEHISYGSEHIIEQEDCDETTSDDGDDDDSSYASEHITNQDDCDETTDDDGDDSDDKDKREKSYKAGDGSFLSGDDSVYISEDDVFAESADEEDGSDNSKNSKIGYGSDGQNDNYDHDNDIDSDDTYEYSEIAQERKYGYHADKQNSSYENSEINDSGHLGGQNILRSLSSVTSLELLTDAGEVVLIRELRRCSTFSNLKILSLGEWCMAPGFDALIFLLQHSPVIERLFLQLKLVCVTCIFVVGVFMPGHVLNNSFVDLHKNFNPRSKKALETSIKLQRRSFTCKDLQMVKIKCSKDDVRVHKLANLFISNGVPLDKILVHRSGSACDSYCIPSLHMPFICSHAIF
ncbi:hypothetical protein CFC21_021943 [Triticum aestivum]|uniref:F-box domain-containing protein n=2 Tax=Triticum aestivum TaxID=4565 RepID=A0A9R1EBG3_WHEAT|nr:hypothetical protein CFC21_021943 [Triticum aestivum]